MKFLKKENGDCFKINSPILSHRYGLKLSHHPYLTLLNGTLIPWFDSWKYLGMTLKSGDKFSCCIKEKLCSFYRALNSIIRIDGRPDEMVLLQLLEAHCLPILTYGVEIIYVANREDRRQLCIA